MIKSLLVLLIVCVAVGADDCVPSALETIQLVPEDYQGKWFENRWRPPADIAGTVMLDTVDYTFTITEAAVDTHDTLIISSRPTPEAKCGQITYAMPVGSSHFVFDLPDNHVNTTNGFNDGPRTTIDMWILGIDKDNYFVSAFCEKDSTGVCRSETMEYSVWSRLPDGVPDDSMTAVRTVLEAQCVEYDEMLVTEHNSENGCCAFNSETLEGVANFDVTEFTSGSWFEQYFRPSIEQTHSDFRFSDITITASGDATELITTIALRIENKKNAYTAQCVKNLHTYALADDSTGHGTSTNTEGYIYLDTNTHPQLDWWVVATDYTSYAITALCTKHTRPGWDFCIDETIRYSVWSRTEEAISDDAIATLQEVMDEQCVSIEDDMVQIVHDGKCSSCDIVTKDADMATVENIDITKSGGVWYGQYLRFPIKNTLLQVLTFKEYVANITDTDDPLVKNVLSSYWIDVFRMDGEEHCVSDKGTLTYTTDPTQPAVYNGSFTYSGPSASTFLENTKILDTDYDNYAIVQGCDRMEDGLCDFSTAYYRISTRSTEPLSEDLRNKIQQFLNSKCEDLDDMFVLLQGNECSKEEKHSGAVICDVHVVAVFMSSVILFFMYM